MHRKYNKSLPQEVEENSQESQLMNNINLNVLKIVIKSNGHFMKAT